MRGKLVPRSEVPFLNPFNRDPLKLLCANGRNLKQGCGVRLFVMSSCWCMDMDKLFETALADAAYWQDFERLQELVPALKAAVETKSQRRTHPSRAETRRKRPSSRLCQPVLNQLEFHTWLDGAVQSRAFAERLKCA
jgi:hypothetical protein